jgi:hypothetical protein
VTPPSQTNHPDAVAGRAGTTLAYTGTATRIKGVRDTSTTVVSTTIDRADPIDLPAGDGIAALVVAHLPLHQDRGRHHQRRPGDYLTWLVELIDEAERVLEPGGRLVLIARPNESRQPHIDLPTQLLRPLIEAGFTDPTTRSWLPDTGGNDGIDTPRAHANGGGPASATPLWKVLSAGKNHEHRAGTVRQRKRLGLPHATRAVPNHLRHLTASEQWPIPAATPGGRIAQGALPADLVALIVSLSTFVNDVIVTPLTGASTVVADTADQLDRRALCFEPDPEVLARLHTDRTPPSDRETT